ncbi:MAG: hypothetical protein V7L20_18330 [Nostoc sp.]
MRTLAPGFARKGSGCGLWIGRADPDADHEQQDGGHCPPSPRRHLAWRHVQRSGVRRA